MGNETFQIVMTLLGGLAVFIYGMNLMSDGLQKAAGDKMRRVLSMLTSKPIYGVIAGALVTAVLQSSSATTVMVIGFTSAGLMKLPQAISVILGANIGTTITAQLIAFKIGDYAWIFVFVGFVMYFFIKKRERIMDIGQVMFGFGLLFVGINIMSDTMRPLANSQFFVDLMLQVQDVPILGILVGMITTIVVQSSSAVIAVLQNLAGTVGPDGHGTLLSLSASLPILFGSNIGTTITALLASIGTSVNAKRTAIAHTVFNICGTLIFIWFVPQICYVVDLISPSGNPADVIARQIANAHLLFNVINTIIFLPLIFVLVKIVTKVVPGEDIQPPTSEPIFLDENVINQPVFAIYLALQELGRLAEMTSGMMTDAKQAFLANEMGLVDKVIEADVTVNNLRAKIVDYLALLLSSESITEAQTERVAGLFHVAGDIEHIGDYSKNIVNLAKERVNNKYEFSDTAYAEIYECFDIAQRMLRETMEALETSDVNKANEVLDLEKTMNATELRLRHQHMQRVNEKLCSPVFTVIYTDTIHNLERIGDSCNNIAQAVINGSKLHGTSEKIEPVPDEA